MEDLIEELIELAFEVVWPKIQKLFKFIGKTLIPAIALSAIEARDKARLKKFNSELDLKAGEALTVSDSEYFDEKK